MKGDPPLFKGGPSFFKGGWKYVLSNPPFLWVAASTLEGRPPLNEGGSPFIRVDHPYEGWIKKGWTMGGPPFRRVIHSRVDQKRMQDWWTTLSKGG